MAEAEEGETTEPEVTEDEEEEDMAQPGEDGEDEEGEDLEAVAEENEKLIDELEKESKTTKPPDEKPPESEALKGKIDDQTMQDLLQVEKEAKEAAVVIYELKMRIEELLTKEKMTEEEEKELEEKNKELKDQMLLFDEKTKQIQDIIVKTNILDSMPVRQPQEKHEEDVLPRMILCGLEDEYGPKIVVCHQKIKGVGGKSRECFPGCPGPSPPPCVPPLTKKPSYSRPEKNEELEKIKAQLEQDITTKNRMLEELQLKLGNLQNEIHSIAAENSQLNDKIRRIQQEQAKKIQQNCQPKQMCPSMLAARLQEYHNYTRKLERQVAEMEEDFDRVHKEICVAMKARDEMSKNPTALPPCRRR